MIFNIFKGEAKTRNKSWVKETDFLSKLSSVWSSPRHYRHFALLSAERQWQCRAISSRYLQRKIAIVVAARQPGRHQRKRIVLANCGCDQTRLVVLCVHSLACFIHQYFTTIIVLIFRSHRVPVSRGVWLLSASHWVQSILCLRVRRPSTGVLHRSVGRHSDLDDASSLMP